MKETNPFPKNLAKEDFKALLNSDLEKMNAKKNNEKNSKNPLIDTEDK